MAVDPLSRRFPFGLTPVMVRELELIDLDERMPDEIKNHPGWHPFDASTETVLWRLEHPAWHVQSKPDAERPRSLVDAHYQQWIEMEGRFRRDYLLSAVRAGTLSFCASFVVILILQVLGH